MGLLKGLLKFTAFIAVLVGIFVLVMRLFFVDLATVGHNAMAPSFVAGDKIAMWRLDGSETPSIGDVLLCAHPRQPGQYVLGRVTGLTGFKVEAKNGQLAINNQRVDIDIRGEMRFTDTTVNRTDTMIWGIEKLSSREHAVFMRKGVKLVIRPATVRRGIYLLGDNRTAVGNDSRAFGEVDPTTCRGRAFMRVQPAPPRGDELETSWLEFVD